MLWMVKRELDGERLDLEGKREQYKELKEQLREAEAKLNGCGIEKPYRYLKKGPCVDDENYYEVMRLATEVNRVKEKLDTCPYNTPSVIDALHTCISSLENTKEQIEEALINLSGLLQEDKIRRTSDIFNLFKTSDSANLIQHECLNIAECGINAYVAQKIDNHDLLSSAIQ